MKKIILVGLSIFIAGCSFGPSPKFINGNYYMGGDDNCQKYNVSGNRIQCMDENGTVTGYRSPMTNQELQMYQFQSQQAQQQMNQFNQGMNQFSQDAQKLNTPKYTNCYKTYSGANCISY